jgi:hypothetical protein
LAAAAFMAVKVVDSTVEADSAVVTPEAGKS